MPAFGSWPNGWMRTTSWWSTTPGSFRPGSWATRIAAAKWNCCSTTCRRLKETAAVPQAARARATHRGHLKIGQVLNFGEALTATVLALPEPGVAEVRFTAVGGDPVAAVLAAGAVPLPPYIHRPAAAADRETYQTVFAAPAGAVACPTAGLHFTGAVLEDLARRGVEIVRLTLHVGPGTFMPVRR